MNLGQEFSAYAVQAEKGSLRIRNCYGHLEELALGGTAVGTGMNTHAEFGLRGAEFLSRTTGIPFRRADNLFEALAARDSNLELMGAVNTVATSLMKIAQDLRLLASGPRSALGEITLPALQPGSSIMPGKVNPVIPEMVIQAAAHVMGKHLSVTIACQNGPLELNIMQPLIAFEVLSSLDLLRRSAEALESRCVTGIIAHEERCRGYIEQSLAMVTPLAREIGYDRAAALAYQAYRQNKTIREVVSAAGVVTPSRLEELLDVEGFKGL
jgi:fumarate hydratase class II